MTSENNSSGGTVARQSLRKPNSNALATAFAPKPPSPSRSTDADQQNVQKRRPATSLSPFSKGKQPQSFHWPEFGLFRRTLESLPRRGASTLDLPLPHATSPPELLRPLRGRDPNAQLV